MLLLWPCSTFYTDSNERASLTFCCVLVEIEYLWVSPLFSLSTSGCLFERKLCTRDQFCSDGEYKHTHRMQHKNKSTSQTKPLFQTWALNFKQTGHFSRPFSALLRPHWIINPASGHTYSVCPWQHADTNPRLWKHTNTSQGFFLPRPRVSASRSSPAPFPFFSPRPPLSKPLLRPAVSMATLTSWWGRHPHSCCANTAMSHWHALTHFSVETALTHGHWREYKMDRRMPGPGCSDAHLWFWGPNTQRSILDVMHTQRVFFFFLSDLVWNESFCLSDFFVSSRT